jgi:hypothetical protein
MTVQQLLIAAVHEASWIVAEYLEQRRDAEKAIDKLIVLLDKPDLAAAIERLENAHGLRVVK